MQRIVHLKQSGELMTDQPGYSWTPEAVLKSAERIKEIHGKAGELGIAGLMVISGAGNDTRGDELRRIFTNPDSEMAKCLDALGRKGTERNAIMIHAALTDLQVPHAIVGAPGMGFRDRAVGTVEPYDTEMVRDLYAQERVVCIAGGYGDDNQTTDAACLQYTTREGAAFPGYASMAFKTTAFNGIYNADPRKVRTARRYERISAQQMIDEGLGGIDGQCMELIADAPGDTELLVYSSEYTPLEALERGAAGGVGTIITSRLVEATFAETAALAAAN